MYILHYTKKNVILYCNIAIHCVDVYVCNARNKIFLYIFSSTLIFYSLDYKKKKKRKNTYLSNENLIFSLMLIL